MYPTCVSSKLCEFIWLVVSLWRGVSCLEREKNGILASSTVWNWLLYNTSDWNVPKVRIMVQVHRMGGSMTAMWISSNSTMWDCHWWLEWMCAVAQLCKLWRIILCKAAKVKFQSVALHDGALSALTNGGLGWVQRGIMRNAQFRRIVYCTICIVHNQGGTMPTSKPDNEDAQWLRGGQCIKCPGFELP